MNGEHELKRLSGSIQKLEKSLVDQSSMIDRVLERTDREVRLLRAENGGLRNELNGLKEDLNRLVQIQPDVEMHTEGF